MKTITDSKKMALVALAGPPNAGKSTLLNTLIGQKLSIVTPKVQTTRNNIKGVVNIDNSQIVFIDTPGIFQPKRSLERHIVKVAWQGIAEADFIGILCDAKCYAIDEFTFILKQLRTYEKRCFLLINKVDLLTDKSKLFGIAKQFEELNFFEKIFMISAIKNKGVDDTIKFISKEAPARDWMFDEDVITDSTERNLAEDITREQLYFALASELPYAIAVKTELWEEQNNGSTKIYQVIYVLKNSQKPIIIGHNGQNIKEISRRARQKITSMLGRQAHLFLYVKVKEDWVEEPNFDL